MINICDNTAEYLALLRLADSDFAQAEHCLLAIKEIEDRKVQFSLACHAVICYCRPFTSNRGVNTSKVNIDKSLLPEEINDDHNRIMAARNQIVAHTDVSWRKPQLSSYTASNGHCYAMAFKGFYYEHAIELGDIIRGLLPVVKQICLEEQIKCQGIISNIKTKSK